MSSRLKASTSFRRLSAVTESSMRYLGLQFARNESRDMVEFEVSAPARFLVRITHLHEVEHPSAVFGFILPRRQNESTDFRIEYPEGPGHGKEFGSQLVKAVLAGLPKPPWKGLGIIESMTAKQLWNRTAEGRE